MIYSILEICSIMHTGKIYKNSHSTVVRFGTLVMSSSKTNA